MLRKYLSLAGIFLKATFSMTQSTSTISFKPSITIARLHYLANENGTSFPPEFAIYPNTGKSNTCITASGYNRRNQITRDLLSSKRNTFHHLVNPSDVMTSIN
ncbi:MAG: hypothetical protein EOM06_05740 [Sphingobacteriia bacterium]|nr:hypothetical protein [Sphingobacteriia bacterium]